MYEIVSGTAGKDTLVRLATFLHVAGPDALDKYNGFLFESEEDKANIEKVLEKFDCETGTFKFRVFRKASNTGRLLDYESYSPDIHKRNVVKSLVQRALKICSDS